MEINEKLSTFRTEINYIENSDVKRFLCNALLTIPDYFYEIPASSTGKYHPQYSLGEGGLVRHTRAAAKMAKMFYELEMYEKAFTSIQRDLMIVALVLHDSYKLGYPQEQYTRFDHPIIAANAVRSLEGLDNIVTEVTVEEGKVSMPGKDFIAMCIETHMGQWVTDYKGNKVLNKPSNKYQNFVHMCDFLASRKYIEVDIEAPLR